MLDLVQVHEAPGQSTPCQVGDPEGDFTLPHVYHGAGRNSLRGIHPPADGYRSRILRLDVRVSHPNGLAMRMCAAGPLKGTARGPRWFHGRLRFAVLVTAGVAQPAMAQVGDSVTAWRALLGSTAVEVRQGRAEVRVGVAGEGGEVALVLRAADLRRFADSATRLDSRRGPWRVRIEEPGVSAGALELSRQAGVRGAAVYRLFAADDVVGAVTDSLARSEVRLLIRRLRAAALAAAPPPPPRRRRP